MGEILTNFGENRQHLPSKTPWETGGARPNGLVGLGKKEWMSYTGQVSAGQALQPALIWLLTVVAALLTVGGWHVSAGWGL